MNEGVTYRKGEAARIPQRLVCVW